MNALVKVNGNIIISTTINGQFFEQKYENCTLDQAKKRFKQMIDYKLEQDVKELIKDTKI